MNMENMNILWVDKYAPKTLDDLVLSDNIKEYFKNMLKSKNILNMTLGGPPGIGKTTICNVLCREMDAEKLFIKCAVEGTVATAQGKLKEFCDALSFDGKPKIVILDEVDASSATQDSSFQKTLRNLIEAAQSDTRFLLNCNYLNKVIDPIKSRCPVINLEFNKKDLLKRIRYILDEEKIEYGKEDLKSFIEVAFGLYPDIRRIIGYLQGCCNSGKLIISKAAISNSEHEELIKDLITTTLNSTNILDARKYYLSLKDKISDYVIAGSNVFDYVVDNSIITDLDAILRMTNMIYQLNVVVDKEPTFFGLLTLIKKYGIQK